MKALTLLPFLLLPACYYSKPREVSQDIHLKAVEQVRAGQITYLVDTELGICWAKVTYNTLQLVPTQPCKKLLGLVQVSPTGEVSYAQH